MRGKNIRGRDDLQRRIKVELPLDDIHTDPLQRQKRRVPFVHVKHVGLNSKRGERFDTAEAEHDFLAHPHLEVASVKLGGDQPVLRAVLRNIGVEKIDVYPADSQFPNPGENFPIQDRH